ncbi:MAG TPA: hypothetical protein DCP31_01190, partial [Cyanobacteria bacterium UBA8543]|nr:hypothetical protein [Cyanobacteria bacterium UBA8543]
MLGKITPKTEIGEAKGLLRIRLYSLDANEELYAKGNFNGEGRMENAIANKKGDLPLEKMIFVGWASCPWVAVFARDTMKASTQRKQDSLFPRLPT